MWFLNLFSKEKKEERTRKHLERVAEELFDVTFSENELWLCYNWHKVAPMSILTEKTDIDECMALVSVMRELYVKRHL